MYLKSLEMTGFKSFADRTRLRFEPGMTAIVGPNGCGKSNVSDAIRWVLGEQRPTALRGGKMLDVIFSGTDSRKPLGMAEVNITFADCEQLLQTDYNEVTITRRAYRSGDNQYLINRSTCRLRDIQRLFMGTGIGTASYSLMAQGQIDAVLSSRPEDRRAIFEEASGITKFKADRKEAMRKLEQTEVNLTRLEDVIREVKRQIGSLQRQAGKARRYQALRETLRGLDLYVTRKRLGDLDRHIRIREADVAETAAVIEQALAAVAAGEKQHAALQNSVRELEREAGGLGETIAQARNRLASIRERMQINAQRIGEYQALTQRDNQEIRDAAGRIDALEQRATTQRQTLEEAVTARREAQAALRESQAAFETERKALAQARAELQSLRDTAVERERTAARLQNQSAEIEARQRNVVLQRERLRVEQAQLERARETALQQATGLQAEIEQCEATVQTAAERLATLEAQREAGAERLRENRETLSETRSILAAKQAQHELYSRQDRAREGFPAGSRLLMNPGNPLALPADSVLGALADLLQAPPDIRPALQAALRAWHDTLVVKDAPTLRAALTALAREAPEDGATRLLAADWQNAPAMQLPEAENDRDPPPGRPLLDCLTVDVRYRETAHRLFDRVMLVETLDALPDQLPPGYTFVSRDGSLLRTDGLAERWTPGSQAASPLARRMAIRDLAAACKTLSQQTEALRTAIAKRDTEQQARLQAIAEARKVLDLERRQMARKEGERQSIVRDAERAAQRFETVSVELETCSREGDAERTRKQEIDARLAETLAGREALVEALSRQSARQHEAERRDAEAQNRLTEQRVRFSGLDQQTQRLESELEATQHQAADLSRQIETRNESIRQHAARMQALQAENSQLDNQRQAIEPEIERLQNAAVQVQEHRNARDRERAQAERRLSEQRDNLDAQRTRKNTLELDLAESRLRRQNRLERIGETYGMSPDELLAEPDPDWPDGPPPLESIESRIAKLNQDLQAMGPVNLVAIDEHQALEERYAFLNAQQEDLTRSRDQVMDLIRRINKKSAEMFRETFEQANVNFQRMFETLFNGGTARLELLDSDDLLDSGIDVVARPPGKKLQSISLLSGGERTLTAVSLLFAIYLIKPSPFCMLDELDAALDDSNIGRFVNLLKTFIDQSQFVIITHNHHTITASDVVYGITMPESGISRVMSMRLRDMGGAGELDLVQGDAESTGPAGPTAPAGGN